MQNEHGFIKVGVSSDAESRRKKICASDRCSAALVLLIEDYAYKEYDLHLELSEHIAYGEWFFDTKKVRRIIESELERKINWKNEISDPISSNEWLRNLESLRLHESQKKLLRRLINELSNFPEITDDWDSRFYNQKIWKSIWEYSEGQLTICSTTSGEDGKSICVAYREGSEAGEILPDYVRSISDALKTWPDNSRPLDWTGSATDCCVAGLTNRLQRMAERGPYLSLSLRG
ncbi:hypothetical protein FJQ54_13950 [Sandaracinobacter neustonicus]|uniref:Uncharacterized protein n=1 Tax=Sandaracinobacter neustonicus TaxID=1715348 RepID=A0A501XGI8_9SPHN|nr:hypothetical protein [Sandaracinobacter neustonicus]TPE59575.1 hypothetical protein FJQ54_13950 [Sandaracinobacter neustonicus]